MRRAVLKHVGGYEALKVEVMEDVRLAEMLKRSGAHLLSEHAPSLASTRMYRNFTEIWACSTQKLVFRRKVVTSLRDVLCLVHVSHCRGNFRMHGGNPKNQNLQEPGHHSRNEQ